MVAIDLVFFYFHTVEVNGSRQHFGYQHYSKYIILCSRVQRNSYRFKTTWEKVNDDRIYIFKVQPWNYPVHGGSYSTERLFKGLICVCFTLRGSVLSKITLDHLRDLKRGYSQMFSINSVQLGNQDSPSQSLRLTLSWQFTRLCYGVSSKLTSNDQSQWCSSVWIMIQRKQLVLSCIRRLRKSPLNHTNAQLIVCVCVCVISWYIHGAF